MYTHTHSIVYYVVICYIIQYYPILYCVVLFYVLLHGLILWYIVYIYYILYYTWYVVYIFYIYIYIYTYILYIYTYTRTRRKKSLNKYDQYHLRFSSISGKWWGWETQTQSTGFQHWVERIAAMTFWDNTCSASSVWLPLLKRISKVGYVRQVGNCRDFHDKGWSLLDKRGDSLRTNRYIRYMDR